MTTHQDPTALVVGGTSGIGLATANALQRRGANVHVVGRDAKRLASALAGNPELRGHTADAGSSADMDALFGDIGTIDWLVVTVGGSEGLGPLAGLDLNALHRAYDAKLWPTLTTLQAALPHLASGASITLVGAITARAGAPGTAGIASLNGAVEALVKPLAVELAPIRVNAVSPGYVDTPWWDGFGEEARRGLFDSAAASLPVRQVARPEQIAETIELLATNTNLTGTVLEADGGARLVPVA